MSEVARTSPLGTQVVLTHAGAHSQRLVLQTSLSHQSAALRVLVLTNMYPTPDQPWRGRFVAEQVEDLRRLGLDVDVYAFDGRGDRHAYVRAARSVRALVRRQTYDLVHAHYGLTGAVALAQRRAPVVTTFHGSDVAIPWQRRISRIVSRRSTPIFVEESQRRRLRLDDGDIISSAVDTDAFIPRNRQQARAALGWDPERPHVLLPAARDNPVKRADVFDLVVAVAQGRLPGLVGSSLDGLRRDEVALAMSAADVVLLPSDSEGSPVAVKEALACETPVVATRVGDIADVIAGLPACGTANQEPNALADLVVRAVGVPRNGALRKRALEFARDRTAQRIVGVYRQVIEAADPGANSGS